MLDSVAYSLTLADLTKTENKFQILKNNNYQLTLKKTNFNNYEQ